ncbi:alpha/beta hydrolase [Acidaminobacter sp. JC074]|uniref:intracellular short-chain-length polyhydroxyalkanoate depolymerase n=1 Tax=Acidaminobacter sp. JC074 TaxID=2530199 RepID=UPI001F0FA438|nr:alpha/beta hydrolase [Acidaminobacter sp. JC074]MCH4886016.1 alpha/beta hydrolase [Acidaminobacter sp. JC074]
MALKFVSLDHETIAYREQGHGDKVVILIHGNMTSSAHYNLLMDRLTKDMKVYAVDLRGFGGSTYINPVNHLKDFSDDIKAFVSALKIDKFTIAGWSTGGGIAMQYCIDYPDDVEKLILFESVGISGYPIFRKDENGQAIVGDFLTTKEELAKDFVQVLPILNAYENKDKETLRAIWDALIYTNKKPDEDMYDYYLEDMLTQRNLVDVDYALMYFNISSEHNGVTEGTGEVSKLKLPTLIFQGKNDLVVPLEMGQGIYKAMDHATYVLHEGGHSPFIDDLDMVVEELEKFL